jgi:hypothetical protein
MQLWVPWWEVISLLQPAFSRWRTCVWFTVCVAGFSVRADKLGVTSIVRALGLDGKCYDNLLDNLHSTGVKLDALSATWAKAVLRVFPGLVRVNGRLVLVGDGIKVGKQGRKMPGVKLLHQASESNTKPEYIMGHSFQVVSILARAAQSIFAVPLAARIHEGVVETNRDRRTLVDKMVALLAIVAIEEPYYYHFWMKLMKPLKRRNGNQYLHREPATYRKAVKRKLHAYHVLVQAGIVAQGLAQYLAACYPQQVWRAFGSWLRTIRPGLAPSELVVTTALRHGLPEFLLDRTQGHILAKFIVERQDPDRSEVFRPAA